MTSRCIALLASLSLSVAILGCSRGDLPQASSSDASPSLEVDLVSVRRDKIARELELVGTLIPIRGTTIAPDVDGVIASFPESDRLFEYLKDGQLKSQALGLNLGHKVKEGDVLVKLDDTEFRLAVEAAQAELNLVRRLRDELVAWKRAEEKQQAEAQLEEATATVLLGELQLDRAEELRRTNTISQGELDVLVMKAECAKAAEKRAQAAFDMANEGPTPEQLAVADARIAAAESQVKLRQDDLDKTTIRAPYDAVIVDRFVDVGDRVESMPHTDIMQICDPRALLAQVAVPEQYQGRIKLFDQSGTNDGLQQVWIHADSLSEKIAGRIDLINVKVEPATRTFRVRVLIDNRQELLKPGGFVRVSLPIASAVDVPVVPEDAISLDEGQHVVFVYQDGRVKRRPVSVGISNHETREIRSGLSGDELVVVGNTSLLTDGISVRPRDNAPGAVAVESNTLSGSSAGHAERDGTLASAQTEAGR